jgi:hypothetical protein
MLCLFSTVFGFVVQHAGQQQFAWLMHNSLHVAAAADDQAG